MANELLFKRGTSSELQDTIKNKKIISGSFYLTIDDGKLYYGVDSDIVQYINTYQLEDFFHIGQTDPGITSGKIWIDTSEISTIDADNVEF